jgi:hypothetical protein
MIHILIKNRITCVEAEEENGMEFSGGGHTGPNGEFGVVRLNERDSKGCHIFGIASSK